MNTKAIIQRSANKTEMMIIMFLFAPPVTSFFPGILPVLVVIVPRVVVAKIMI